MEQINCNSFDQCCHELYRIRQKMPTSLPRSEYNSNLLRLQSRLVNIVNKTHSRCCFYERLGLILQKFGGSSRSFVNLNIFGKANRCVRRSSHTAVAYCCTSVSYKSRLNVNMKQQNETRIKSENELFMTWRRALAISPAQRISVSHNNSKHAKELNFLLPHPISWLFCTRGNGEGMAGVLSIFSSCK